jgi:short-subunit dehydrogenase
MVGMLHSELAGSSIRVAALQPGPMRTSLRAKAYAEEADAQARDPVDYAEACVTLLSPAGAVHRGEIWNVRA